MVLISSTDLMVNKKKKVIRENISICIKIKMNCYIETVYLSSILHSFLCVNCTAIGHCHFDLEYKKAGIHKAGITFPVTHLSPSPAVVILPSHKT